jgi:hypothetical protein
MRLDLHAPDQPFRPVSDHGDRRTASVEDFKDDQLAFFAEIIPAIGDPEMRARVADVLWIRRRDYRHAELAITSYLEAASTLEDPVQWTAATKRVERALQLSALIGRKTQSFAKVVNYIESVLERLNGNDPYFFSSRLMRMLLDRRLGDPTKCISLAEKLACAAENKLNWDVAREYWSLKAKWHGRVSDTEGERDARLREAESYVKQSETHLQGNPPSYTLASHWLQQAIEALRRVGNASDRIEELHLKLLEYQQFSTAELHTISSSVDLTSVAERAVEQVSGQSLVAALVMLAQLVRSPQVQKLRHDAELNRQKYIGINLFPKIYLNALGRVVARQPQDREESLIADMHSNANQTRSIDAQGVIEPARQQILSEHNATLTDFVTLLENNRLIPRGRELIVARGLHVGLYGDFLVAAHLLIPQIEESLRFVMAQVGLITSAIDEDGIQQEYNVNRILSSSKYTDRLTQLFGEDLLFDMRGLLIERFGANFRNTLAHALLDHDEFYSAIGCYAWWLCLRFYMLPQLVSRIRQDQAK